MRKQLICIILTAYIASNAFAAEDQVPPSQSSGSVLSNEAPDISSTAPSPPLILDKNSGKYIMSQSGSEDLTHTTLTSDLNKKKDLSIFVDAGVAIPVYDSTFCDFLDYGAAVNVGVAKKISSDFSITASIGAVMMTGEWSIRGDRRSIEIAAESWSPGIISEPGQVVIYPEDVPPENLGEGYHASGEAVVTSAENLERLDIDTTLYLFPIRLGALYHFKEIGKIKPYIGGGLGAFIADRKVDSKELKTKYFDGPEYGIKLEKSQTVTGMLLDFVFGFDIPFRNNMLFYTHVNTTLYDLDSFDPIIEVSYQKTSPAPFTGSDITTFSYEDPQKIGVYNNVLITNISLGLIIPF